MHPIMNNDLCAINDRPETFGEVIKNEYDNLKKLNKVLESIIGNLYGCNCTDENEPEIICMFDAVKAVRTETAKALAKAEEIRSILC